MTNIVTIATTTTSNIDVEFFVTQSRKKIDVDFFEDGFGCQKKSTSKFLTPKAVLKTALGVKKFDVDFFDTHDKTCEVDDKQRHA